MVYASGDDIIGYNAKGEFVGEIDKRHYTKRKTPNGPVFFHQDLDDQQVEKLLKDYLASPAQSREASRKQ
jgi:hypothetical protein